MKQIITFIFILATALSVHSSLWEKAGGFMGNLQGINETKIVVRPKAPQSLDESSEATYRDITLTAAGTLAEALGEDANLVDSLVVRGPINEADFKTMWSASFHGKLEVINLENAEIENNVIPKNAFWDADVQYIDNRVYLIKLKKIILPENITEIGEKAFYYGRFIEDINLPASLTKISERAFAFCAKLPTPSFPENLEEIGESAYRYCHGIKGEVVMPEKLRSIGGYAFENSDITKINFPTSLEYLGGGAFSGTLLGEVYLPDNCELDPSGGQFMSNPELVKAHLPANSTIVPQNMFIQCYKLREVELPERLETIGYSAFQGDQEIEEIVFPSSLKSIGDWAFAGTKPQKIYSKAVTAPMCTPTTFRGVPNTTSLYIPVGSRNDYVSTQNYWYNFINIIETDDFPSLSVSGIDVDGGDEADAPVYDLMGRRVDSPQPGQIYIRAGKKFTVKP